MTPPQLAPPLAFDVCAVERLLAQSSPIAEGRARRLLVDFTRLVSRQVEAPETDDALASQLLVCRDAIEACLLAADALLEVQRPVAAHAMVVRALGLARQVVPGAA